MKIITFASIKGGVGKSVSSLLFAEILSENKKVILIDGDSQASLTSYYIEPDNNHYNNLYDLFTGQADLKNTMKKINDNLFFIPSHISLSQFNKINEIGFEYKLKEILTDIDMDYCIIDTPPSLSNELITALVVTNDVIVPISPNLWSFEALQIIENEINKIRKYYNDKLKNIFLIQTMFEKNRKVQSDLLDVIKSSYADNFINIPIHKRTVVEKLITYRQKINKKTDYYNEYNKIIKRVCNE